MSKDEINMADILADFRKELKAHDWYYEYSEDMGVYRKGFTERQALVSIFILLDDKSIDELLIEFCPQDDWLRIRAQVDRLRARRIENE